MRCGLGFEFILIKCVKTLPSEDRSQLSGVLQMNISCSYIRIRAHAGVERGSSRLLMAGDALVAVLMDESGSRPADCNSEIPSWPCQI